MPHSSKSFVLLVADIKSSSEERGTSASGKSRRNCLMMLAMAWTSLVLNGPGELSRICRPIMMLGSYFPVNKRLIHRSTIRPDLVCGEAPPDERGHDRALLSAARCARLLLCKSSSRVSACWIADQGERATRFGISDPSLAMRPARSSRASSVFAAFSIRIS